MLALLVGAGVVVALLGLGLVLFAVHIAHPARHTTAASRSARGGAATTRGAPNGSTAPVGAHSASSAGGESSEQRARDALAARVMPSVDVSASEPAPVSTADPGAPIVLPAARETGPAGVATGFPHTAAGALAQLAAIDQTALQSGSLSGVRAVIAGWAAPGGPTTMSWSGVAAMAQFLDAAGLSGGGSPQLAMVVTPLMGEIKGSVGPDFVVPCADFEVDVTVSQTARGAVADCERMVWRGGRWMIGPGHEPADPPSVWPDTDTAIGVGYRDLRRG